MKHKLTSIFILILVITNIMSIIAYADISYTENTRDISGVIGLFYPSYQRSDKDIEWSKQGMAQITVEFKDGELKKGTGTMIGQDSMLTSSLLIYEEATNSKGYTYPIIGDIKDITVNMVVNNKNKTYKIGKDNLFISDIADRTIRGIDSEKLDSDFEYDTSLLSECYLVISLDSCIGLETGFYPLSNFSFDYNKYIQVRTDEGSLVENKVEHGSITTNEGITYNERVDLENSIGAPALTLHVDENTKRKKIGYILAGINQGQHKGKNIITTFNQKRDLFSSKKFFTSVPQDFIYSDSVDRVENGDIVYGTKGYNPTGKILSLDGSYNYIDNNMKKEYPFSPICIIAIVFDDGLGGTESSVVTGQLIDKNKIITCSHGFKVSETVLKEIIAENRRKNKAVNSPWGNIINSDTIYEREIAKLNELKKSKDLEKQKRIDNKLDLYDIFVLERSGLREKSEISEEYERRRKRMEDNVNKNGTEIGVRHWISQDRKNEAIENEKQAIKEVENEIENEIMHEMNYKYVWEIDSFIGIQADFMYNTELQQPSTTDIYDIKVADVHIHSDYTGTDKNDISIITLDNNLGEKYGYFGLTSKIRDGELYSLSGYPDELIDGNLKAVLKNMYLTSNTEGVDKNLGDYNDYLYYYDISTAKGFSGSGLKSRSSTGDDYRIASIHYGKDVDTGYPVGNRITKEVVEWVQSIK